MDATEQQRIYLTAVRQGIDQQRATPTAREGDRLIVEALTAFLDADARIDLRAWVRDARAYLGTTDQPTAELQEARRAQLADMGRI